MLKKLLLFLILIIFITSGCAKKVREADLYNSIVKKGVLVVGVSVDAKPFGFLDKDGQIKGLEADLAKLIAERILGDPNKVIFKKISPQERINAVKSGDVDIVIASMTITPQRKKIVDFSIPYFVAGQVICVKKDSKIDSYYDLNNKRVVVILETTGEKNIRRFAPNALIQGYADNIQALDAFKSGSEDAITTDDSLLQPFIMENKDYILLPERLTNEPYGIAFKKSKQSKTLKKNIDDIIEEIMYNGTLDSIKEKWGISEF